MTPAELEDCLHERLPLTQAMQVSVVSVQRESVILSAPLLPNINHHETVFGGSASTLAITAAWSLVYVRLKEAGIATDLVIQRNTMEYERPMTGAFTARSFIVREDAWPVFIRMLARKGRARINVSAVLEHQGQVAGRFIGEFVALKTF